ncbi:MAG: HAMP domain-containing histidine kinase, partial [Chloroherpetonaceae bacterium]|nr:HAMP domain-containing histidine kinase [Chloroherpetonaceae bacterium]
WCAALSSSDQEIHGQITVYIVALFGLAAAQLYPLWESLVLYIVPHLVLLLGISHFQSDADTASAHYVNSTVSALVAWLISRMLYANWVKDFYAREKEKMLLQQLAEQTEQLRAEKAQTDRLLRELSEASWELALTNESLREANKFKSEILAIAAHDLKNPLQSIIGFTSLIAESESLSHIKEMTQIIQRSAARMAAIIQEVLESAAVESNLSTLSKSHTDFSGLVTHIVSRFAEQAQLKQQTLYTDIAPNCYAEVDSRHIRSVLENLLSNAIKYSYHGGRIWVCLEQRDHFVPQRMQVTELAESQASSRPSSTLHILPSVPDTPYLVFSVKDEGQGLSEEDMGKLFGKFQRLSALPTGGENSTGLGLYLAKQIVEAHGGYIWAESAGRDKGATFFVALPASPPHKK